MSSLLLLSILTALSIQSLITSFLDYCNILLLSLSVPMSPSLVPPLVYYQNELPKTHFWSYSSTRYKGLAPYPTIWTTLVSLLHYSTPHGLSTQVISNCILLSPCTFIHTISHTINKFSQSSSLKYYTFFKEYSNTTLSTSLDNSTLVPSKFICLSTTRHIMSYGESLTLW